jgi:tRNA(Ile)-lysidine synthase
MRNFQRPPVDFSLLPPHERVLVAVSGGADSLALLLALQEERENLHVAHINHGLRGAESDEDEAFVVSLCHALKAEITTRRVHVESQNGRFSENAARLARYAALRQIAHENSCSIIVTGHTANDQLETVLLNLARGAAVGGLAGIAPCRVLDSGLRVVRPLLGVTRTQTETLCHHHAVQWRDDSSNACLRLNRNRVRHQIVPALCEVAKKDADVLSRQAARAAQLWRDDVEFLEQAAKALLQLLQLRSRLDVLALDGLMFCKAPDAMQRRVLRAAARQVLAEDELGGEIGSEMVESVRRYVAAGGRRRVWQWRGGLNVEWTGATSGNRIRLWRVEINESGAEEQPHSLL